MASPIEFPEQTTTLAKDHATYLPLPAWQGGDETITLWKLSWRERLRVVFTGRVWLRVLNFGQPLQPQKIQAEYPFEPASHHTRSDEG